MSGLRTQQMRVLRDSDGLAYIAGVDVVAAITNVAQELAAVENTEAAQALRMLATALAPMVNPDAALPQLDLPPVRRCGDCLGVVREFPHADPDIAYTVILNAASSRHGGWLVSQTASRGWVAVPYDPRKDERSGMARYKLHEHQR